MGEMLASPLQAALYRRLDYLERLVADGDQRSRAVLADTEITRLTAAWRALLAEHTPDQRGRCPQCSGLRRRRRHPCSVWTTAYRHLINGDTPAPGTASAPDSGRSVCWRSRDRGPPPAAEPTTHLSTRTRETATLPAATPALTAVGPAPGRLATRHAARSDNYCPCGHHGAGRRRQLLGHAVAIGGAARKST
jgi:hypothetical protein